MSKVVHRRGLGGASPWVLGAALALAASGASAQVGAGAGTRGSPAADGDAEPAEVEEVVVTGSFIRGTPEDAALPVDVIGSEELAQQGSPTVVQLVKNLPAAQSSIGESNRFLGTAAGSATVNLRGFGASRTLVLFNGRRMAASPTAIAGEAADINFIPAAAIGRVEVLREGAAATYGSEAIGGVVNFISRTDLDGLEITGQYAFIDGSEGDYDINAAYGWRGDQGDFLLTAGYRRRSELRTVDRDWAIRPFAENNFGGWSTASNPGVFQTGPVNAQGLFTPVTSFLDNGCTEVGGTLVNPAVPSAGCRFQFSLHDNLVNDEFHYQLYSEVNFDFTEDLSFHAEAFWSRHDVPRERVSSAQSTVQFPTPILASGGSPGGGTSPYPAIGQNQQSRYFVPPTNPGLIAFLARSCPALGAAVCTNASTNGVITSQTQWRPQGFGGNPLTNDADTQRRAAEAFRVAAGFNGELPLGINFDVGVTYMKADGLREDAGPFRHAPAVGATRPGRTGLQPRHGHAGRRPVHVLQPVLQLVRGEPGHRSAEPLPRSRAPERSGALRLDARGPVGPGHPDAVVDLGRRVQRRHADHPARGTRRLRRRSAVSLRLGGGPPQHRRRFRSDQLRRQPALRRRSADLPQRRGTLDLLRQRTRVRRRPDRQLRVRRNADSHPGQPRGQRRHPLRGLWRQRRRDHEPSGVGPLGGSGLADAAGFGGLHLPGAAADLHHPGFARVLSNFIVGGQSLYRPADRNNNPNLRPETADTYNVGVLFKVRDFRASIDYFNFAFKDELTEETPAAVINTLFPGTGPNRCGVTALRSRFTFADDGNPATDDCAPGNLLGVQTNLINGPSVDTSGVDFSASYIFGDLFAGDLTIGVDGSHLIEYARGPLLTLDGFEIAPALDRAGKSELLSAFYSYPKWKANAYVNFARGPHNARYVLRYKQGTDNLVGASVLETEDTIEHDITYTVELPYDTVLTFSVQNLLDTDPEFTRSQYNYDYTQTNPLGRVFEVGFKKLF
jgi:iron complex outermembrane receptor protein